MRSEKEILDWLRARCARAGVGGLAIGIGDDAAVLRPRAGWDWVVTTDLFVENVHFRRDWLSAEEAGSRALARALSDIAAMGALARFAFLSVAAPRTLATGWLERFFRGALRLARRFRVQLAGGDLGRTSGGVHVDAIALGQVERGRALTRSGARPGDLLFVTGRLGLSRAGIEVLRCGLARRAEFRTSLRAHRKPSPRCAIGRYLVRKRMASAAIDLSDGLSTDLDHLCDESRVGARIEGARLPLPALQAASKKLLRLDPLALALHGGEDYELLFTVPRARAARMPTRIEGVRVTHIGEITRERRVVLREASGRERLLRPAGWDHFR